MNPTDTHAGQAAVASSEFDDGVDEIEYRLDQMAGMLDWLAEDLSRIAGTLALLAALRG
jgi:hypothetical protein